MICSMGEAWKVKQPSAQSRGTSACKDSCQTQGGMSPYYRTSATEPVSLYRIEGGPAFGIYLFFRAVMPENQEGIAFSFSLAHTYFREVFSTRSAVYRVEGNISSAPHNHRLAINSMSYTEDALRVIPSFVLTYLIAVLRRSREVVVFLIRLPHILGTVFWSRAQFVVPTAHNRLVLNHVGGHPTPIAPIMHIYAL